MSEFYSCRITAKALIELDDKILILKKKNLNSPNEIDCWELPGGGAEAKEDPIEALKREIFEECNLKLETYKLSHYWQQNRKDFQILALVFRCTVREFDIKLSDEHTDYHLLEKSEISKFNFVKGLKKELDKYFI